MGNALLLRPTSPTPVRCAPPGTKARHRHICTQLPPSSPASLKWFKQTCATRPAGHGIPTPVCSPASRTLPHYLQCTKTPMHATHPDAQLSSVGFTRVLVEIMLNC
mmetsp:Transcript_7794/g.16745  ORF Transcript_7794/g.16745 Transcript_7794/m.16745 type:complete len:106 (+) Transcript_7794:865-1182(+)